MLTQRDQITGEQLPVDDRCIITDRHFARLHNHPFSAKAKAKVKTYPPETNLSVVDLLMIKSEKDKPKPRDKYLITKLEDQKCYLRKFTTTQFRSKLYEVPLSACFPLSHQEHVSDCGEPVRGLDNESSDDEGSVVHIKPCCNASSC